MPTPAVSITEWTAKPYSLRYSTGQNYEYMRPNGDLRTESRPASQSIPYVNGRRACANWFHNGSKWVKGGGSVRFGSAAPGGTQAVYSGCIDEASFPTAPLPSQNMRNRSLAECLVNLKQQDFHVGVFLAEARQTIDMFKSTANLIRKSVEEYKRREFHNWLIAKVWQGRVSRRDWCKIPSSYLQMQYGWTPLLSDLFGAIHHLKKKERPPSVIVTKTVGDEEHLYQDRTCVGGLTTRAHFITEQRCTTFLSYGLKSPVLAELSSLGLINPAEIIWEKVPYSFVVDWVVPVGTWLSSLTAPVGFEYLGGGQSLKATMKCESVRFLAKAANVLSYSIPQVTGKAESFARNCYGSQPFPGLYVKNPLSASHIASASALLLQAFLK